MKILHCCLSNFFIDNYAYQENILPAINKADGHEVKIISSTETFINNSKLGYLEPGRYFIKDGIEVIRVPYRRYLPHALMKKIRHYKNVYNLIEEYSPDVILFHGVPAYELLTVANYKKNNPATKLYVDSHEDKNNSARNWLSEYILHKTIYRSIIKQAYQYIDKFLYLSIETKAFLREFYEIEEDKMEFFPLGGIIIDNNKRGECRSKIRRLLGLKEDDILLVHSGKLDKLKRTEELLKAFTSVENDKLSLIIIGSIPEDQNEIIMDYTQKDRRVSYLGWKNSDELLEYLCASDLYAQPGSQSATMQSALCCGSAAMLYPHESYKYLLDDSVFYIETVDDIRNLIEEISRDRGVLEKKRVQSNKLAQEVLDYKRLAARIYR